MRKMIVIAMREYQAAVKTKAFIISVVLMPVLMGGSIVVQRIMKDRVDTTDKRFAILDKTGRLYEAVAAEAELRNTGSIDDGDGIFKGSGTDRKQVKPRFLVEQARVSTDDPDRAALELSRRVRDKEIHGFVIIGADAIRLDADADGDRATIAYYSNSPTYFDFQRWVSRVLNDHIQTLRLEASNLSSQLVKQATRYMPVANLGLVSVDETGTLTEAKETNRVASMLMPMGMMMLMFMVVLVGASPLMQSVIEEKMQRIAEVLLGSVTPFQLMMGKLVGSVGVSLTMATIYLVGAYVVAHRAGFGQFVPSSLVWWFVLFLTLAVLLYGSIFIAIGAAVTDMREAQSMMTPVMMVVVSPMFVWFNVVREPLSTSSMLMSLFPPATPMLMTLRQSVPPGVPLWQPVLGVALVLLTCLFCVFAAGRVFRVGILMQGKGANVREMFRWVLRG